MMRTRGTAIVCLILGVFLMGMVWGTPVAAAGGKLRVSLLGDLINIDPAGMGWGQDRYVGQQVFQGLFEFNYSGQPPFMPVPVLVKRHEVSPDGKVITLEIHKGVQFHHGYGELTSEDVVFNLKRHLDPNVASRAKQQLADVEQVEALDKYTVKISLKRPSALTVISNLAWQNAGFMLSKKAVEKLGEKINSFPVGTGPYYFVEWNPGEKVILERFDDYWGTPGKFDGIEFWIVPEETVALGALERGDLDIAIVSQVGSYDRVKAMKGVYIQEATANADATQVYVNHLAEPMDDPRVRKALAHALDIKGIADRLGPMVEAWPSPIPSAVFPGTTEFWTYEYNIDKAKKLLADAGYPNGFKMKMIYNKAYLREPISLEVANCWKQVVDVDLELVERAVWSKVLKQFNHHIAVWGCCRLAPFLYAQLYLEGSARNYGQYLNPEVDEIVMKATTATTERKAKFWWRKFQQVTTEDVAYYWPAVQKGLAAVRKDVKGVIVTPFVGLLDLDNAYRE